MKRLIVLFTSLTLLLSGCGAANTMGNHPGGDPPGQDMVPDKNAVTGKVTAIEGTEFTLTLGTMKRPEGDPTEQQLPKGGERPSGQENSSRPEPDKNGSRPERDSPIGGFSETFEEDGTTKVISIGDEALIKNGSLSDIEINTFLQVSYKEDGNIKSVSILKEPSPAFEREKDNSSNLSPSSQNE